MSAAAAPVTGTGVSATPVARHRRSAVARSERAVRARSYARAYSRNRGRVRAHTSESAGRDAVARKRDGAW